MKFLIGFALFLLLGWLGIHSGITDKWPGGGGAKSAQNKLEIKAKSALLSNGLHMLSLEMRGQRAVLKGILASNDAKETAVRIVLKSAGSGGLLMGGITSVDTDNLQIVPPVNNPYWSASLAADGRMSLSGYVANEQDRNQILEFVKPLYLDEPLDNMKVAPGVFENALPQMLGALQLMTKLDQAALTLQNGTLTLSGAAPNQQLADDISMQMQQLEGIFATTSEISHPSLVPNEFGLIVEEGPISDGAKCQDLFHQSLSKNQILFASAKADIGSDSFEFLNFLAGLAQQCGAFSLQISGHTDGTGDPAFNDYLSKERAKAVVNFMVDKGVRQDQLSFVGFGSKNPVCTERTRACRASNRRIEITVEQ